MADIIGTLANSNGDTLFPSVIKTVTNSFGTAYKFADGTMITARRTTGLTVNINTAWGNLFYGEVLDGDGNAYWSFPEPFAENTTPVVMVDILPTGNYGCFKMPYASMTVTNTRITHVYAARPTAYATVPVELQIMAIGRWK